MERAEEIEDIIAARRDGKFLAEAGRGEEIPWQALSTCTGHAVSLMLKVISNTFPTRQILHRLFPKEHTTATCELCGKEDETIAHFTLNCPQLKDATTAAHDTVRRRLSRTLENALAHSSD